MEYFKILDDESTETDLILEGYIALYDGEDLTGEYFHKSTDFNSSYVRQNTVLIDWEHGVRPDDVKAQPGRDDVLGKIDSLTLRSDDIGILARHVLDRRERYVEEFIRPLAEAKMLGSSSEAVPEGIKRTNGRIDAWPLKRQSFTVNPAEPRLLDQHQMQVVKSLSEKYPALKSLIGEGITTAEGSNGDETITNGDNNMPDNNETVTDAVSRDEFNELKDTLGNISTAISGIAETQKAYQQADNTPAPKKAGVVVTEDETDKQINTTKNRFGLFLQGVKNVATQAPLNKAQKAILGQNESVPSEGGYLVQTEQDNTIEKKMFESAVFASRSTNRVLSANANSIDFYGRSENSRAAGSRFGGIRGYRVAEGQTITASQMDFYKYTLKPSKYAVVAYATDEVAADAALLESEILEAAPQELAFLVDDDMLNGTSAGYPKGILSANCTVSVPKETGQDAATVKAENVIKMWARMWARSRANAAWFINQDVEPQLITMNVAVGTGGQLIYMPPGGLSGNPYGTLFGRPVIPTEFNATLGTVGDIVLADWSQYKLANKGAVQAASSMHVQFLTDQMCWRFTARYAGQATWESELTPFKGTNTQSPFITLATRS